MTRCACALLFFAGSTAAWAAAAGEPPPPLVESKFELFVHDSELSVRFYRGLGFEVAHRTDHGYVTLRSDPIVVALSPVPGWLPLHWLGFLRLPPLGTEIVFYSGELAALRAALVAAGYDPSEIVRQPWGDRDFRVRDPDGYYLRISEGGAIPAAK